jgi:hypothetical protein
MATLGAPAFAITGSILGTPLMLGARSTPFQVFGLLLQHLL